MDRCLLCGWANGTEGGVSAGGVVQGLQASVPGLEMDKSGRVGAGEGAGLQVVGSACISQVLTEGGGVGQLCVGLPDLCGAQDSEGGSVPHIDISTRRSHETAATETRFGILSARLA